MHDEFEEVHVQINTQTTVLVVSECTVTFEEEEATE